MSLPKSIRIGTRQSALALKQVSIVQKKVQTYYPDLHVEVVPISTAGDRDKTSSLSEIGGKSVFVKDIDQALLDQEIDLAVHSLKDVTTFVPDGVTLSGFLKAESVSDVFVFSNGKPCFEKGHDGLLFGTSSKRREGLIRYYFPEAKVAPIRGNVGTRLDKCDSGDFDCILLSGAGLIRLGLEDRIVLNANPHVFVPAPGQGVITLACRSEDSFVLDLSRKIQDEDQAELTLIERDYQSLLGFDCQDPLGLYAFRLDGRRFLKLYVSRPEFTGHYFDLIACSADQDYLSTFKESVSTVLAWQEAS